MKNSKIHFFYPYDSILIGYIIIGLILSKTYNFEINWLILFDFKYDQVLLKVTAIALLIFLPLYYLKIRSKQKITPGKSFMASLTYMKTSILNWANIFEFFRILAAMKLIMTIHCTVKQSIPIINPALHDDLLWKIDKVIHLGFSPTLLPLKLLSIPAVTSFIDITYVLWYFVKLPFFIIFIWFVDQKKRYHFFSSYFLLWIVGGLLALLFPSVGPIYKYPDLFADLNIPHAFELQKQLWIHYNEVLRHPENFTTFIYEGVAAFPCLHVGIVVLFCIFSKKLNKTLFIIMLFYVLIIQIGSVHLGWHYAIDGYFGTLLAFFCYFITMPAKPQKTVTLPAMGEKESVA